MKNILVKIFIVSFCLWLLVIETYAQSDAYIINGSATQNSCNCYTLTRDQGTLSGSVWNKYKISLLDSFDFVFNVYLGCKDASGADGIVFMLQPLSTNVGTTGEGMGFQGVSPSIGISLDTWQNTNQSDPAYDHISLQANGNVHHSGDMAPYMQASSTSDNIEDCAWHTLRVKWDPITTTISTFFDGVQRIVHQADIVKNIFNNDPYVYWGFSGATGGSSNLQQFCTALNPGFLVNAPSANACFTPGGTSISFTDQSISFAPIKNYLWSYGDGDTSMRQMPPAHTYKAPGIYNTSLIITGFDGCKSDTLKKVITIGDKPVASFVPFDTCAGSYTRIQNNTAVTVGNIASAYWLVDGNAATVTGNNITQALSTGVHTLQLIAASNIGCIDTSTLKTFNVKPVPQVTASVNKIDACTQDVIQFSAQVDTVAIARQAWLFGDGKTSTMAYTSHSYSAAGTYYALFTATAVNGCIAVPDTVLLTIHAVTAQAGNDTIAEQFSTLTLQASGGNTYTWSPATGLSDAHIANPVATVGDKDITYTVLVQDAYGCKATDDITITVYKGTFIYAPTAFTPNRDGLNDVIYPYCLGIKEIVTWSVYNRWGNQVFSTATKNKGWDGRLQGQLQPQGAYIWTIKAIDYFGKVKEASGSFILIR